MISLKKRSEGFTIVELLIVIVVIGILATLVIVTFTGIQQKARDSQRQTDINAINNSLAAYYAQNGSYPTVAALNDPSFRSANLKGLDPEALLAPNSTTAISAAAATTAKYQYDPSGCSGTATTDTCTGYTLSALLEGGSPFTKQSNN